MGWAKALGIFIFGVVCGAAAFCAWLIIMLNGTRIVLW